MSIISAVQTYIKTYTELEANAPVWVDYLGKEPTQYGISQLPGARIVETYLNESTLREFPFAFEAVVSNAADAVRLENLGFFEAFAHWLDTQSKAGTLPSLGTGKTAEKIEALGWGYPFDESESGTSVYQIQCKLTYSEVAP